jgi:hypothetical protein
VVSTQSTTPSILYFFFFFFIQHAAVVLLGINYLHSGYQTRKQQEAKARTSQLIKVGQPMITVFLCFCDIRYQTSLFSNILLSSFHIQ